MPRETWTWEELFEGLEPAPSFVSELERLGLLRVVARDGHGKPLYGPEARQQLEKVLALVELGYDPRDIAAIARRVGLPSARRGLFRRPPTYIRLAELARRTGVDAARLALWQKQGILRASLETEGGEPLFPTATVERVIAVQDLLHFGFEQDDIARWTAISASLDVLSNGESPAPATVPDAPPPLAEAAAALEQIRLRMERLRAGIRRWDKLLAEMDKRVERARKAAGVDEAPRRTLMRRRPRRARRNRSATTDSGPDEA